MSETNFANQTPKRWSVSRLTMPLMGVVLAVLVLAASGSAQTTTRTGTDQMTPSNLAAGSPAGSYALSGFDNVNLFNGNLSFRLPLLAVGGRGSAGFTMMLALNTKTWHVRRVSTIANNEETITYLPTPNTWQPRQVGYGPGVMIARKSGEGTFQPAVYPCNNPLQRTYEKTITRLTFTTSDGTEFEFLDQLTMGQPYTTTSGDCTDPFGGFSRGRVWVTVSGEAATFISDGAISDRNVATSGGTFFETPSGYLFLRDGTRYRINAGLVSWIQDRNGNRITFSYDINSRVNLIVDSLNRQISVTYDDSSATDCTTHYDVITFTGFGGSARTIQVGHNCLSTALRSDQTQTPKSYHDLFPELNGDTRSSFNPKVVTSLLLPDGVRRYQFSYNSYGEVARVVLPTGGAYEYDYTATSGVGYDNVTGIDFEVYRRVVARRVMPDGTNVEGRTSYSPSTGVTGLTIVNHWDSTGTVLLAHDEHTFLTDGQPLQLGSTFHIILYQDVLDGLEDHADAMDTDGATSLRQEVNSYASDSTSWPGYTFHLPINPRLTDTLTKLLDVSPALVSKRHLDYDQYNNPTNVEEYDFGSGTPGALVRRSTTSYVTSNNGVSYATVNPNTTNPDPSATVHLRSLPLQQSVFEGSTEKSRTTFEYDHYNQTTLEDFHNSLTNRTNITGLDGASTTTYYTRGNLTKTTSAVSFDASGNVAASVSGYAQYDIAGNVVKVIDPRSTPTNIIATTFDFNDAYGYADSTAEGNELPLPVELESTVHTYAFATKVTNALNQNVFIQYDYYLGKPVNGEDANGIISKARYDDALDRPTGVDAGIFTGSQLQRHTSFVYSDSSHLITTQSDQTTLNDGVLTGSIMYDGLGRTIETRTSAPEGTIFTKQEFDAMGRVKRSYNPYRTTSDPTYGYADTAYDALGRVLTVTTSDNAVVTTSYSGNTVTVTDQAAKVRRSVTDGLGRLKQVIEDPLGLAYSTTYGYDALDDLTSVTQGTQTRSFSYDALKRLTQATNPESGTINYSLYDANRNLLQKTDARGITTTYVYDALNRLTSRTYTNDPQNTPAVTYKYDGQSPPTGAPSFARGASIGRLVAVTYGGTSAGTYTGYDQLGRVNVSVQQTDSQNYGFGYGYNLASEMTTETYPSGRVITSGFDTAGRLSSVNGQKTGEQGKTYASQFIYAAQGAVAAMQLGNGKVGHTSFNNRLQPTLIGLGTSSTDSSILKLDYDYGTTNNNGNVVSQKITAPGLTLNQCYGYDALNRLSTAEERSGGTLCSGTQQWKQAFAYDRYGNRNFDVANTTSNVLGANPTISQSTNRFSGGQGYGYDAAGNLTSEPATSANGIVYDAENRQTQYTKTGQQTNYYYYDGDGHRVKKVDGTGTTVFVYNAGGQLIAEYTSGPPQGSGTSYLTSDHLCSTRVVMKADGSVARHDYLPFGEEIQSGIGVARQGWATWWIPFARSSPKKKEIMNRGWITSLRGFTRRLKADSAVRTHSVDLEIIRRRSIVLPMCKIIL